MSSQSKSAVETATTATMKLFLLELSLLMQKHNVSIVANEGGFYGSIEMSWKLGHFEEKITETEPK